MFEEKVKEWNDTEKDENGQPVAWWRRNMVRGNPPPDHSTYNEEFADTYNDGYED